MRKLLFIFALLFVIVGCDHEKPQCVDPWATTGIDEDSFVKEHHYWKNFNLVTTDSLYLESHIPGELSSIYTRDSAVFGSGDEIVVANVAVVPDDSLDSVWVMVARDQITMGWVRETELLDKSVPDNPISRFIHQFSDSRFLVFLGVVFIAIALFWIQRFRRERFQIVHFNDIGSFYPTLLCLTVSGSATLYGSVQKFCPDVWRAFYFHPTLNPFGQPTVIMVFLASVWLMLVVFVAVLDDLHKHSKMVNAVTYLASLCGVCMILYFVFTLSVHVYIGYPLLVLYWAFALYQHWTNNHTPYRCGHCGSALHEQGKCPYCGAINS